MTEWLQLSDEQRRTTLEQAAIRAGIPGKAIEKDWWITLTLKALFCYCKASRKLCKTLVGRLRNLAKRQDQFHSH